MGRFSSKLTAFCYRFIQTGLSSNSAAVIPISSKAMMIAGHYRVERVVLGTQSDCEKTRGPGCQGGKAGIMVRILRAKSKFDGLGIRAVRFGSRIDAQATRRRVQELRILV
jgi:hypothetical protein